MKNLLVLIVAVFSFAISTAQQEFYSKKGVAVEGYDVTEYFNGNAIKGNKDFQSVYQKTTFYFKNAANKVKFDANPTAFLPEYGGYCAYAVGKKGTKVKVDPETFSIENGKVYLFYNAWGTNTLDLWNKEGASELKKKADRNWDNIKGQH